MKIFEKHFGISAPLNIALWGGFTGFRTQILRLFSVEIMRVLSFKVKGYARECVIASLLVKFGGKLHLNDEIAQQPNLKIQLFRRVGFFFLTISGLSRFLRITFDF